jgi:hypothetical protein
MAALYFAFVMDVEASLRYYVEKRLPLKEMCMSVKSGMNDEIFKRFIRQARYLPTTKKEKIKTFAVKHLIRRRWVIPFILYSKIISKHKERMLDMQVSVRRPKR